MLHALKSKTVLIVAAMAWLSAAPILAEDAASGVDDSMSSSISSAPADATPAETPTETPTPAPAEAAAPVVNPSETNFAAAPDDPNAADGKVENAGVTEEVSSESRKQGIQALVKKLSPKSGKKPKIVLLKPIDYTTMDYGSLASSTLQRVLDKYGQFDIVNKDDPMKALTLEEFRRVVAHSNADVVFVTVLKPTNFDMFLYDRKTPYYIYAHSEVLPEANQYKLTKDIVSDYMKTLSRRTLYAYLQDQYYELPREDKPMATKQDIPRWIASSEALAVVNHDIMSNAYFTAAFGTALASGTGGNWNSNLLSIAGGYKIFDSTYIEGGLDAFAYNVLNASLKYAIVSRDTPLRFYIGGGLAYSINQHTLNYDQSYTQGLQDVYFMGSASVAFPISDIYFKLESKVYVGFSPMAVVFTVAPGLMLLF